MVAIVIDLGQLRSTRQGEQTTADLAALAAGVQLAGIESGGVLVSDTAQACYDAFSYVRRNSPSLPAAATMDNVAPNNDGCPSLPTRQSCVSEDPANGIAGTQPKDAVARIAGTGSLPDPYRVVVRYPVLDTDIADSNAPGDRATDGESCERMKVSITRTRSTFFGRVAGQGSLTTTVSAVIRGFGDSVPTQVPALLLLERVGCGVLTTQGSSGLSQVIVDAVDPLNPGLIQADSYGVPNRDNCDSAAATSDPQQSVTNNIVFGTAMASSVTPPKQPSIIAGDCFYTPPATSLTVCSTSGPAVARGQVALNAITVGSPFRVYKNTGTPGVDLGVQGTQAPASVASRSVVDNKYYTAVQDIKTTSDNLLDLSNNVIAGGRSQLLAACGNATNLACGYSLYPDAFGVACGDNIPVGTTVSVSRLLVKETCDLNPTSNSVPLTFSGTSSMIVSGKISVGSGRTLSLPDATQVFVAGCSPTVAADGATVGCGNNASGGNNLSVSVQGTFSVNTDSAASCTGTTDPGVLVVRTGRVEASGRWTTCQTFVYLSGISPRVSGTSQSISSSDHSSCTIDKPCTITTPNDLQYVNVQGTVIWTAPNQNTTTQRDPSDPRQAFEDLALWVEGSKDTPIKGVGNTDTTGVFFLPKSNFTFQGQTGATPRDAQFISRRLFLSGQGKFRMKPIPQNSVGTPKPHFSLIR
jgi:hypothetical protein